MADSKHGVLASTLFAIAIALGGGAISFAWSAKTENAKVKDEFLLAKSTAKSAYESWEELHRANSAILFERDFPPLSDAQMAMAKKASEQFGVDLESATLSMQIVNGINRNRTPPEKGGLPFDEMTAAIEADKQIALMSAMKDKLDASNAEKNWLFVGAAFAFLFAVVLLACGAVLVMPEKESC